MGSWNFINNSREKEPSITHTCYHVDIVLVKHNGLCSTCFSQLTFQLPGEKPREFHSTRRDSVEIIGLITAQLKNVFPITQLE